MYSYIHIGCQITSILDLFLSSDGLKDLTLCLLTGQVRSLTMTILRRVQKATLKLESQEKKVHEGGNLDPMFLGPKP